MTLCLSCAKTMLERKDYRSRVQLQPIGVAA